MTKQNYQAQIVSDAFWSPGLHVGLNYRLASALRAASMFATKDGELLNKIADSIQRSYQ